LARRRLFGWNVRLVTVHSTKFGMVKSAAQRYGMGRGPSNLALGVGFGRRTG
jgi:hypothetical protein